MAVLSGHVVQGAQQQGGAVEERLRLRSGAAVEVDVEGLVEEADGITDLVATGDLGPVETFFGLPELVDEVGPRLGERFWGEGGEGRGVLGDQTGARDGGVVVVFAIAAGSFSARR
ncbi:hypothetical protein A3L22_28930 [Streptomyces griseus subsp. griseus]|nr:hypothetical protein A3L22_28930 [Streptomyces griseus subsp. griseus]